MLRFEKLDSRALAAGLTLLADSQADDEGISIFIDWDYDPELGLSAIAGEITYTQFGDSGEELFSRLVEFDVDNESLDLEGDDLDVVIDATVQDAGTEQADLAAVVSVADGDQVRADAVIEGDDMQAFVAAVDSAITELDLENNITVDERPEPATARDDFLACPFGAD